MGAQNLRGSPVTGPLVLRINQNTAGDTAVLAAVAGQKHRIYGYRISVDGATDISIKDGAGTVLEVFNFGAGGSCFFELREEPYYTGTANTAFIINSSNAVQVDGRLEYFTAV